MTFLGILNNRNDKNPDKPPGVLLPIFSDMKDTIKNVKSNVVSSLAGDLAGNIVKYTVRDRLERRGLLNGRLLGGNQNK